MGSIVSLPFIYLYSIFELNTQINGKWILFIVNWFKLFRKRFNEKRRFDLYDVTIDGEPEDYGLIPKPIEWQLELPSKKAEKIVICGVNSANQTLNVVINIYPNYKNGFNLCHVKLTFNISDEITYEYQKTDLINSDSRDYAIGYLKCRIKNPFRYSELKFRGFLTENTKSGSKLVYTRFVFLLLPIEKIFDFQSDFDNKFISTQTCRNEACDVDVLSIFPNYFEQTVHLKGYFQIENETENELHIWGTRSKMVCDGVDNFSITKFTGRTKRGHQVVISLIETSNGFKFYNGYICWGQIVVHNLKNVSDNILDAFNGASNIKFTSEGGGRSFTVIGNKLYQDQLVYKLTINGIDGCGIISCFQLNNDFDDSKLQIPLKKCDISSSDLVLSLHNEAAKNEAISGGKGSSLAFLTELSTKTDQFNVPKALIVTTHSSKLILKSYPKVEQLINSLQELTWSKERSKLKENCEKVVNEISSCLLPEQIKTEIEKKLIKEFGDKWNSLKFAVRSSACGEDSEDMSCAGQMTTFLGMKGLEQISAATMKCFASQFGFNAVEYKRSYGQLINTPMAVVIQEMVDCETAGVLFTCDPITGDQRKILITANYGLGESVVSSSSEPDSVVLNVKVDSDPWIVESINSIDIGSKQTMIKLNESSDGTEEIPVMNPNECCISENEAKILGSISLIVQKYYGSERDIEWGIKNERIYLLQSRPITNINQVIDWELMHETDTGHPSECEYNTKANIGEVFPGTSSHLGSTFGYKLFIKPYFRRLMLVDGITKDKFISHFKKALTVVYNHSFFSLKDGGLFDMSKDNEGFVSKAITLAFLGHELNDDQMKIDASERLIRKTTIQSLRQLFFCLVPAFRSQKNYENYRKRLILPEAKNSREHLWNLMRNDYLFLDTFWIHMDNTFSSSFCNLLLLVALKNERNDNTLMLSDFAKLLSSCKEIVSAEVPKNLQEISENIPESVKFAEMSDEQALQYLSNEETNVGKLFKKFMDNHGHRTLKEFDLVSKTWSEDPTFVIRTLKTSMATKSTERIQRQSLTANELCNSLETPMGFIRRLFLEHIALRLSMKMVRRREMSKSACIWAMNEYRKELRVLGDMMTHREGRVPETDLIYYLTLDELLSLTEHRNPSLVSLAKRRKKLLAEMNNYIFDEIVIGADMKPRNFQEPLSDIKLNGNRVVKLEGTPVSGGRYKGRICVAPQIADAVHIQPGDILVTYCTDIGWSPYFPILGGLVTEIGGLVSHGAVIAREYGLPCIVGIKNACSLLRTGDCVLLESAKGVLTVIED